MVQQLTGGTAAKHQLDQPISKSPFVSNAVPLGSVVPDKVKSKIWSNEYIDLGILLNTQFSDNDYKIKLQENKFGQKNVPINTIDSWTDAFQI